MSYTNINTMVLGTAQLGFDYGIANKTGRPSESESMKILEAAWRSGIRYFDTAPAYNSEAILGRFIATHGIKKEIKILTKISSLQNKKGWKSVLQNSITQSLNTLTSDAVEVVFFHNADDSAFLLSEPDFFIDLLASYPISCFGVSVYEPEQIRRLKDCPLDLAFQFPYNICDRRFENNAIPVGKRYGRSVFLQGLLASRHLKRSAQKELKTVHSTIHKFCSENNISLFEEAIRFAANSKSIDFFLVGVDKLEHLEDILKIDLGNFAYQSHLDSLPSLFDNKWLDPRRWS